MNKFREFIKKVESGKAFSVEPAYVRKDGIGLIYRLKSLQLNLETKEFICNYE